jgi:zinc finger-like protein
LEDLRCLAAGVPQCLIISLTHIILQAYTCSHYTCPICSKSLGDMAVYFGMLDALLAAEQLPDEYQNSLQDILCNDCEQKGTAPFHWLYHKCSLCGSYNTRNI